MTARMTITLGALALGFATVGALPALAQNTNPGGENNATAPAPTMNTPPTANAGTNAANPNANTPPEQMKPPATGNMAGPSNTQSMETPEQKPAAPMKSGTTHAHATHHTTHHAMRSTQHDSGDAAVARLNEMSLQAAQQGRPFTPGAGMGQGGMGQGGTGQGGMGQMGTDHMGGGQMDNTAPNQMNAPGTNQ